MDLVERFSWVCEAVADLPGAWVEDRPAWDALVLWAGRPGTRHRRWFGLVMAEVAGRSLLTLKGDPDLNHALVGAHEWIVPGYHMNKRHWISVLVADPRAEPDLVLGLLEDAWSATVEKFPAHVREPLLRSLPDPEVVTP